MGYGKHIGPPFFFRIRPGQSRDPWVPAVKLCKKAGLVGLGGIAAEQYVAMKIEAAPGGIFIPIIARNGLARYICRQARCNLARHHGRRHRSQMADPAFAAPQLFPSPYQTSCLYHRF